MRLLEFTSGGYACEPHQSPVQLRTIDVPYPAGCPDCIRKAFAEASEQALKREGNKRT